MKRHVLSLAKNPLISGSAIVFIGGNIANLFQFLFNLFMSRNLSVVEYGILASLMSFIALPSFASNAIGPTVVHFAGRYLAAEEKGKVRGLYIRIGKSAFFLSAGLFILIAVFLNPIGMFFHISDSYLLLLADVIIALGVFLALNTAFLQAKLAFHYIAFINILSAILKFGIGAILVVLGFSVGGAIGAVALATLIPLLGTFVPLRDIFKRGTTSVTTSAWDLLSYGAPSALALSSLSFFITTDIMLVKHFFDPTQAGLYAGLSLIGKVIYFLSAPISIVMFPLIVQKRGRGENYTKTFQLAILLVFLASCAITLFYFFFPDFVIQFFLKHKEYLAVKPYLVYFALFIVFYALLTVVVNFYLSIRKTKIALPLLIGIVAQAGGIWFFHQTLFTVITVSFITVFVLLFLLLLYYPYATRE